MHFQNMRRLQPQLPSSSVCARALSGTLVTHARNSGTQSSSRFWTDMNQSGFGHQGTSSAPHTKDRLASNSVPEPSPPPIPITTDLMHQPSCQADLLAFWHSGGWSRTTSTVVSALGYALDGALITGCRRTAKQILASTHYGTQLEHLGTILESIPRSLPKSFRSHL